LTEQLQKNRDLERIIELSSREVTDEESIEHFNLKNKLESQLEDGNNWQKYSKQIETMIKINSDAKTVEEFFQKHKLPQLLISMTKDGDTKIEKLESTKELEEKLDRIFELIEMSNGDDLPELYYNLKQEFETS